MKRLWANKYQLLIIAFLILLVYVVAHSCSQPCTIDNSKTEQQKKHIQQDKAKRDSIHTEVLTAATIQTVAVLKWRTLKDTIRIPPHCDTIVKTIFQACDSVIAKDSVLISKLSLQCRIDSILIDRQDTLIKHQDLTITDLTKKVKREKRKSWWRGFKAGFVTGNITGGAATYQLTK
jgi:hypothetical protein